METTTARHFDAFDVELSGRNVVNASAGTGKTFAITTLVVRLVVEQHLRIDQILVVTFTEAATAELRDRIRSRLKSASEAFEGVAQSAGSASAKESGSGPQAQRAEVHEADPQLTAYAEQRLRNGGALQLTQDQEHLDAALLDVDRATISTIHGFALNVLKRAAFACALPFENEIVRDLRPLIGQVFDDFWTGKLFDMPLEELERLAPGQASLSRYRLRKLLYDYLRTPDVGLAPEAVIPQEEPADWRQAWTTARQAWNHDQVLSLLATDPGLTGSRPTKASRERWCQAMEEYLQCDAAEPSSIPKTASNLTAKALTKKGGTLPVHPFFDACGHLIATAQAHANHLQLLQTQFRLELVGYVTEELPKRKRRLGQLSFDDLLTQLRDALDGTRGLQLAEELRGEYRAALIDEFQDTDPVQFSIFDQIYGAGKEPLFLIGDPKQAIYAFRGADIFAYLQALRTATERVYTMQVNWRSDPTLLRAVNRIFSPATPEHHPFLLQGIEAVEVEPRPAAEDAFLGAGAFSGPPFEFLFVGRDAGTHREQRIAEWTAADISQLLSSSSSIQGTALVPSDIAILTRTNRQCFDVQRALAALNIPAVVVGDQNVLLSPEARQLLALLSGILDSSNPMALRKALSTDLVGLSAAELHELEQAPVQWESWAGRLRSWHQVWAERGFVQMFRRLLSEGDIAGRLLSYPDGQRRMTNLLHLSELSHIASRQHHLGPAALIQWLERECSIVEAGGSATAEQTEIRLESDAQAVRLTTIHKSKGLEFPVVYCPYLFKDILPGKEADVLSFHDENGELKLAISAAESQLNRDVATKEAVAENLRLLYVALTRAKHRCTVIWGGLAGFKNSALGTLLHPIPPLAFSAETLGKRLDKADDEKLLAAISRLQEGHRECIGVRPVDPEQKGLVLNRTHSQTGVGQLRRVTQPIDAARRTASFSSLAHEGDVAAGAPHPPTATGKDRDEVALNMHAPASPQPPSLPITWLPLPRGPKFGNCIHNILEHLDFQEREGLPELARAQLESYGLAAEHQELLCQGVEELLQTSLVGPCAALRLADLPNAKRLNEMAFHLPVGLDRSKPSLTPHQLAQAFKLHPSQQLPTEYWRQVEMLQFRPLMGFLKGYVDLCFEHEDKYYVVDYKSNHLGDEWADYTEAAMKDSMAAAHYFLQYHLYCVALHRYLQTRIKAYSYDQHFGGVFYLYLKGMHPEAGFPRGVFFEKPPASRVNAIVQALDLAPVSSNLVTTRKAAGS